MYLSIYITKYIITTQYSTNNIRIQNNYFGNIARRGYNDAIIVRQLNKNEY